jgi:Flp pilus assembly protein TadG
MKRRQAGQSLVEVALVLPVLLIILMGIFDFGRAIFAFNTVSNAAREALRIAIVDQNATRVIDEGRQSAIGLDPTTVTVTPAWACNLIGCQATVTVSHQWQAITPIIGSFIGPIQLQSVSDMPIERVYVSP